MRKYRREHEGYCPLPLRCPLCNCNGKNYAIPVLIWESDDLSDGFRCNSCRENVKADSNWPDESLECCPYCLNILFSRSNKYASHLVCLYCSKEYRETSLIMSHIVIEEDIMT